MRNRGFSRRYYSKKDFIIDFEIEDLDEDDDYLDAVNTWSYRTNRWIKRKANYEKYNISRRKQY